MPRPALHDAEAVLDATRELVLEAGPRGAGVREIARRSGAPSGSLYHRFGSRDELLAAAWLRAVGRFQVGFLNALSAEDPREAVARAPAWAVTYALREPQDTRLLLSHSQADLLDGDPGPASAARLADVNKRLESALRELTRRLLGAAHARNLERVTYAVIDLPYAVLRRHIAAGTLGRHVIAPLQAAALAIVGERPAREPAR